MIVTFELDGQKFIGLDGGPEFKFDSRALHEMIISPDEEGATRAIKATLGGPMIWVSPGRGSALYREVADCTSSRLVGSPWWLRLRRGGSVLRASAR